jgi:hypothetical protein
MNSVFSNHDEESDEERVVYLDIGDGAVADGVVVQESNKNNNYIINSSTTIGVKRKPLFQYRKYKGDVRNSIILLLLLMMMMVVIMII